MRSYWFLLGRHFAVRTVSMQTVQDLYFCFGAKPANSKFATTTAKKKCRHCHSSSRNYQKKLKRVKFYWDFKYLWRRWTFAERVQYHREHLETFDSETEMRALPCEISGHELSPITSYFSPVISSTIIKYQLLPIFVYPTHKSLNGNHYH